MERLRECPFCGGTNISIYDNLSFVRDFITSYSEDAYYDYENTIEEESDGGYVIVCSSIKKVDGATVRCGATSRWYPSKSEAIRDWNSRPEDRLAVVFKRKKGDLRV